MKKLLYLFTLSMIAVACNNESTTNEDSTRADSVNTAPVNETSNPNHVPGSNMPGEAMGNGDTSSYENMSQRIDSSK